MTIKAKDRNSPSERACWPQVGDPPLSSITSEEWDGQRYKEYGNHPWWKPWRGYREMAPEWCWHLLQHRTFDTYTRRTLCDGDPMIPGRYIHGGTRLYITLMPTDLRVGIHLRGVTKSAFSRRERLGTGCALGFSIHLPMLEIDLHRGWSGP